MEDSFFLNMINVEIHIVSISVCWFTISNTWKQQFYPSVDIYEYTGGKLHVYIYIYNWANTIWVFLWSHTSFLISTIHILGILENHLMCFNIFN